MTDSLNKFMDLFCPRRDSFALKLWNLNNPQHPEKFYLKQNAILNQEVVTKHLTVKDVEKTSRHIAIYPQNKDDTCIFGCIDVDDHNGKFQHAVLPLAQKIADKFTAVGLPSYLERSQGGLGYHIWIFFCEPVEAKKLRAVMLDVLRDELIKQPEAPTLEVFPKQDSVGDGYGSALALPYGYGSKSTFFSDNNPEQPIPFEQFVESVIALSPEVVDKIISSRGISLVVPKKYQSQPDLSHLPPDDIKFSRAKAYISSILGVSQGNRSNVIYQLAALLQLLGLKSRFV